MIPPKQLKFHKAVQEAIRKVGGKQEALAAELSISPPTLSRKINGETGWNMDEIDAVISIANLEIANYKNLKQSIEVMAKAQCIILNQFFNNDENDEVCVKQ
ncbi:MAG: helix-turn-helix domain-containing protein [Candidatus Magnetoovum sp. WYHC-5]|nr:helix-turn-helix domain-containing protein [Candidatus Magnetoovum sp. WYHC-5]